MLHWRDWKPTDFLGSLAGPVGVAKQPTHHDKDINPNQILEIKLKKSIFVVVCWLVVEFGSLSVEQFLSRVYSVEKKRGGSLQVKST